MELASSVRLERFRAEFRSWLDSNLPGAWRGRAAFETLPAAERLAAMRDWQRRLHEGRWLLVHWPEELGGRGLSRLEQAVVLEELERCEAPPLLNGPSLYTVAPALRTFGTPQQQRRHLPKLLSAEEVWLVGVFEPGAGANLASLETRAERQGEVYLLTGRKICAANLGAADFGCVLARTGPEGSAAAGLSVLLVDLKSSGVAVRAVPGLAGETTHEEVSFDRVEVPVANRIGEENRGREVFLEAAAQECAIAAWTDQLRLAGDLDRAIRLARELGPAGHPPARDPVLRHRLAQAWIELRILRCLALRHLSELESRRSAADPWALTLFAGEVSRRVYDVGLEILGPYGLLWRGSRRSYDDGSFARGRLLWFGRAISRGSPETQRDRIAEELLEGSRAT
jgi:alkylation response protein AidB-like acyl-CoA dehydrogenase